MIRTVKGVVGERPAPTGAPLPGDEPSHVEPLDVRVSNDLVSQTAGWNHPHKAAVAGDPSRVVVYKESVSNFLQSRLGAAPKPADWKEIFVSHFLHDEMGLPSVVYQEAQAEGRNRRGAAVDFVPGLKTLDDLPVSAIRNPDQAVAVNVVRGWMGDGDVALNQGNSFVLPEGNLVGGDFGMALTPHVSTLGIPYANADVMRTYANADNVEPTVNRILSYSRPQLEAMVDRTGRRWVDGWTAERTREVTDVLAHNQEQLRHHNVFADYYQGVHPMLSPQAIRLVQAGNRVAAQVMLSAVEGLAKLVSLVRQPV